jgi:hypothetical protein
MKKNVLLCITTVLLLIASVSNGCDVVEDVQEQVEVAQEKVEEVQEQVEDVKNIVEEVTDGKESEQAISETSIPLNFDFWIKVNTGKWEQTADVIKVYGAGFREGHQGLISKAMYDFRDTETRVKWQANGGGPGIYSAFWVFLISDYVLDTGEYSTAVRGGYFTTDHSWKESVVILPDIWHYTRINVAADGTYTSITATDDYDDAGGSVISETSGEYENADNGNILVIFNDNYGGTDTFIIVGEAITDAKPTGNEVTVTKLTQPEPQDDGLKTIIVFPQPGVTNASVNGISVITDTENRVQIDSNQPLVATYTIINSQGDPAEMTQTLDTYYDFHVLKANGGWASTIHREAFLADKTSE